MKVNYNPTALRLCIFEEHIKEEVEDYLTSPTNTFVVFDGQATIVFEGTLAECYVYSKLYRRNKSFDPCVYSKEAYDEMVNILKA